MYIHILLIIAHPFLSRVARFFLIYVQHTNTGGKCQMTSKYKVFRIAINYANIIYSKALQNLPRFDFWVCK
jgi:hypothetical protein